jgi:ankyrin repeat protein
LLENISFGKLIFLMIMTGETPLHYAVCKGTVNTVRYLLDHGANPDKLGGAHSGSPLHYAVAEGELSILFSAKCKHLSY